MGLKPRKKLTRYEKAMAEVPANWVVLSADSNDGHAEITYAQRLAWWPHRGVGIQSATYWYDERWIPGWRTSYDSGAVLRDRSEAEKVLALFDRPPGESR